MYYLNLVRSMRFMLAAMRFYVRFQTTRQIEIIYQPKISNAPIGLLRFKLDESIFELAL